MSRIRMAADSFRNRMTMVSRQILTLPFTLERMMQFMIDDTSSLLPIIRSVGSWGKRRRCHSGGARSFDLLVGGQRTPK